MSEKNGKYEGFYCDWIEEWSQFTRFDDKWYTFRPWLLEFEWDRLMGGVEFTFVLLGLGVRLRLNYAETEQAKEIKRQVKAITDAEI